MNVKLVLILFASYSSQHLDEFKIIRYNNQLRIAQNTVKGTDKMKDFIDQMLKFNKTFVEEGKYKEFMTTKYPDKKVAIISCMDTRLTALLPAALDLKNGDAKMIKNAGGVISHPFGSVMRSLMVAVYELGVTHILVIGHTDCGMRGLNPVEIEAEMIKRGISEDTLNMIKNCGIDIDGWLRGFDDETESVISTVNVIKEHPLIPDDVTVYGYIMDSTTGEMKEVIK